MKVKFYDKRGLPVCFVWDGNVYLLPFCGPNSYIEDMIEEHGGVENRQLVDFDFELLLFERFGIRGGKCPCHPFDAAILKKILADKIIP